MGGGHGTHRIATISVRVDLLPPLDAAVCVVGLGEMHEAPPVALGGEQMDPLVGPACDATSNQALLLPSGLQEHQPRGCWISLWSGPWGCGIGVGRAPIAQHRLLLPILAVSPAICPLTVLYVNHCNCVQ